MTIFMKNTLFILIRASLIFTINLSSNQSLINISNQPIKVNHQINYILHLSYLSLPLDNIEKVLNKIGSVQFFEVSHCVVWYTFIFPFAIIQIDAGSVVAFVTFQIQLKHSVSFQLLLFNHWLLFLNRKNRSLVCSFCIINN